MKKPIAEKLSKNYYKTKGIEFGMKKIKNIILAWGLLALVASCKHHGNKTESLMISKTKTDRVGKIEMQREEVEVDFVRKFPQKEIKILKDSSLPIPQKTDQQVDKKTLGHVSSISKKEAILIDNIRNVK